MAASHDEVTPTREGVYRDYVIQLALVEEGGESRAEAWCWVERQGSLYPVTLSEKLPGDVSRRQVETAFDQLEQRMKERLDREGYAPADPTEVALSLHRHIFGDAAY